MITMILKIAVIVLIFRLVQGYISINRNSDRINSAWDRFLGNKKD